jgi:hypothetical protein
MRVDLNKTGVGGFMYEWFRFPWPIQELVRELNPVLRGWGNYFHWGQSTRKFTQVDSYVYERLAQFDSRKRGKRGPRWAQVYAYVWFKATGVHILAGSACYGSAATGSMSTRSESRNEGKPHVRFDEGRLARLIAGPVAHFPPVRPTNS